MNYIMSYNEFSGRVVDVKPFVLLLLFFWYLQYLAVLFTFAGGLKWGHFFKVSSSKCALPPQNGVCLP